MHIESLYSILFFISVSFLHETTGILELLMLPVICRTKKSLNNHQISKIDQNHSIEPIISRFLIFKPQIHYALIQRIYSFPPYAIHPTIRHYLVSNQ